jgi:hypothetical protein
MLPETVPPLSKEKWDCTVGGIPGAKYSNQAVEDAIEEALKVLETCTSCKDIFRKTDIDPIDLLKRLRAMSAIFVTDKLPDTPIQLSKPFGPFVHTSKPWPKEIPQPAATVDSQIELGGRRKPCIYLNYTGMLANRPVPEYGELLLRARAEVIIHELAHCAKAIPSDGPETSAGVDQSKENTDCVKRNCRICDANTVHSPCILRLPQKLGGSIVPP